ncbi:MAG: nucleotidyltransferase domain-containing protein [Candidatus Heimdallarchaeota archaeon]|nr:nucleotidyltransferase domain-containing protein [Candidatus Heimdallarchaeota archaeon]
MIPNSIQDIEHPLVRKKLKEWEKEDYILGFLLQGSRVTGFASRDSDYDFFIYVSEDYYQTLEINQIQEFLIEEKDGNKMVVGDFAFVCDTVMKQQFNSQMDIDHIAYVESVVILDKTGKLTEWREKLALYPEEDHEDRIKYKWIQVWVNMHYAELNQGKGNYLDVKVNLHKVLVIIVGIWFNLKKSWIPQLKWWSRYTDKLNMEKETKELFDLALDKTDLNNVKNLILHIEELIQSSGINLAKKETFLSSIMPLGREKYMKYDHY